MAVPSAVARKREREESELRQQGVDPANPAPPEIQLDGTSPPPAPAQPTADPVEHQQQFDQPVVTDDAASLQQRVRELEQELSTTNGRTSASARELAEAKRSLDIVAQNREFLEGQLAAQAQELESLRKAKSAESMGVDIASLDDNAIDEETMSRFGDEGTQKFVTRTIKKVIAPYLKPLFERIAQLENAAARVTEIDKELPALRQSASVAQLSAARDREQEFLRREILPSFQNFEAVAKTPAWRAYLQEKVPGHGELKIQDMLQTHRQTNNAVGIRGLIGAYYERTKSKPSLDSLSVPAKTGTEATPRQPSPKMKNSEYIATLRDFTMKRIPKAQWEEFRTRFETAMAAGNVEADVEIK